MEKPEVEDEGKGKAVENQPSPIKKRKRSDGVSALTQINVLIYERYVNAAFQNQIEKYALFSHILDGFTEDRISGDEVMKKMNFLLQGHEDLLVGLQRFLCSYYDLRTEGCLNMMDAVSFVAKVKEHFDGELTKFKTFLDILTSYQDNNISLAQFYSMVAGLFEDQLDLLEDFKKFIPRQCNS